MTLQEIKDQIAKKLGYSNLLELEADYGWWDIKTPTPEQKKEIEIAAKDKCREVVQNLHKRYGHTSD